MKIYLVVFFFLFQNVYAYGFDLNTPREKRSSIRYAPNEKKIMLVPNDQKGETSNGIPLDTNDPQKFKEHLEEIISKEGKEPFKDAIFFVMGVEIKNKVHMKEKFDKIISELDLKSYNAQVVIYSVPSAVMHEQIKKDWKFFREKFKYFFPNMERDYQTPLLHEALWGLSLSVASNTPNMIFMFHKLPTTDFILTSIVHMSLLSVQTIFAKTYNNWMQRSSSTIEYRQKIEILLKQFVMASIYVTSYNIFGNFTPIVDFYYAHGFEGVKREFGDTFLHFVTTQTPTVILQMIYYAVINNMGFGGWLHRTTGVERTQNARNLMPFMRLPTSALNALLLSMSSNQFLPLAALGPMVINGGQAGLAIASIVGGFIFWRWPKVLDPYLDFAVYLRNGLKGIYQDHFESHIKSIRKALAVFKKEEAAHASVIRSCRGLRRLTLFN